MKELEAWPAGEIQILVAASAVVVARRRGYGSDELGLARPTAVAGLRLGALVSAAVVVGVGVSAAIPVTAGLSVFRW